MSSFLKISNEHEGALVRICLDQPKGNVFTIEVMQALDAAISDAQKDQALKCILLETAGKHFSFGAEVAEHKPDLIGQALAGLRRLILTIAQSPIPVVALVQGLCLGGAFEVVMAAHLVFASKDAKFGLPEITLGVFPPAGSVILPRRLPQSICDQIIMSGATLSAERLHELGFVNETCQSDELGADFEAWFASTLEKSSAVALRHATRASRKSFNAGLESSLLSAEEAYIEELMATHDANEGVNAFLEKRQPEWSNA